MPWASAASAPGRTPADALAATLGLRHRFLGEHLGRWIGPFTEQVKVAARSGFYRELGEFTARFVGMELAAGGAG